MDIIRNIVNNNITKNMLINNKKTIISVIYIIQKNKYLLKFIKIKNKNILYNPNIDIIIIELYENLKNKNIEKYKNKNIYYFENILDNIKNSLLKIFNIKIISKDDDIFNKYKYEIYKNNKYIGSFFIELNKNEFIKLYDNIFYIRINKDLYFYDVIIFYLYIGKCIYLLLYNDNDNIKYVISYFLLLMDINNNDIFIYFKNMIINNKHKQRILNFVISYILYQYYLSNKIIYLDNENIHKILKTFKEDYINYFIKNYIINKN